MENQPTANEENDTRLSDPQFRTFLESAQDVIYIYRLSPTRGYEYVSPSAQAVFGHTPEEFYADPDLPLKMIHPEDQAQLGLGLERCNQLPERVTRRWIHPDGRIVWTENLNTPILDASGNLVAIYGIARDITERKQAEEALSHLAAIVQNSHDAIYRVSLDGVIESWNRGAEDLYGYSAAEIVGHPIARLFEPENRQEIAGLLARISRGETVPEYRQVRRRKDGSRVILSVCWSPIRNEADRIVGASVIGRDMTEPHLTQRFNEALNEINEFIHSTLDASQVMQRVIREAATVLASETAAISLYGPEGWTVRYVHGFPEQVIGSRMNDEQEVHALLAIRTGQPVAIDDALTDARVNHAHMLHWNIRSVLVVPMRIGRRVVGVMFYNYHQRPFHFSQIHIDFATRLASSVALALENARLYEELERELAERKKVEQSLGESEERFHALADNIPQLSWMTDAEGWIFWYNQRWFEYTGTTLEEMEGWGWQKVHHPDHVTRVTEKFKDHIQRGQAWEDTFPLRSKEGEYRWFLSRATPIFDETGKIVRWFGTNTDITERLEAEEALALALSREQQARVEAEDAVRLRDHFFNIAAHELRNPLTTMLGYSELLVRPGGLNDAKRAKRAAQTILHQTVRLDKMIGALLDVSRMVEGQFWLELAPFDLVSLVDRVAEEFRPSARKHTIEFNHPAEPLIVNGDEMRLDQVVRNLIGNAIKYSPEGGAITVTVERCEQEACLSVADHGMGIPADALPHLFERFYRAPNAEAKHVSGLGIGLFVIREIVARHGGTVRVESTEGKGTTFTVHLPLATDAAPSAESNEQ